MFHLLRLGVVLGLLAAVFALPGVAGAAPGDVDNDTIADATDNCPSVYNIDQQDFDSDSVGNTCDSTPGVGAGQSFTIIYHRDATTGGPLSADLTSSRCARVDFIHFQIGFGQIGTDSFCHRQFTTVRYSNPDQTTRVTLTAPAGCRLVSISPLSTNPFTIGYNGSDTFTAINAYYLCDEGLLLENLRVASIGVGPGTSLVDKVALAQASYASGDIAGTCRKLTDYINQVNAQTGKKIPAATAAGLIAQANAIKAEIGC